MDAQTRRKPDDPVRVIGFGLAVLGMMALFFCNMGFVMLTSMVLSVAQLKDTAELYWDLAGRGVFTVVFHYGTILGLVGGILGAVGFFRGRGGTAIGRASSKRDNAISIITMAIGVLMLLVILMWGLLPGPVE
jgi:hypothetical protein